MGIIGKIISQLLGVLTVTGTLGGGVPESDLGVYTPPASINYVETSLEQKGEEMIFGNLSIELPDGVTAEIKTSDIEDADGKEMLTVKLNGAEEIVGDDDSYMGTGPFPPQIKLSRDDY